MSFCHVILYLSSLCYSILYKFLVASFHYLFQYFLCLYCSLFSVIFNPLILPIFISPQFFSSSLTLRIQSTHNYFPLDHNFIFSFIFHPFWFSYPPSPISNLLSAYSSGLNTFSLHHSFSNVFQFSDYINRF